MTQMRPWTLPLMGMLIIYQHPFDRELSQWQCDENLTACTYSSISGVQRRSILCTLLSISISTCPKYLQKVYENHWLTSHQSCWPKPQGCPTLHLLPLLSHLHFRRQNHHRKPPRHEPADAPGKVRFRRTCWPGVENTLSFARFSSRSPRTMNRSSSSP